MQSANLPDFLALLENRSELKRVRASVRNAAEVAEIGRRVSASNASAPAILFERVGESPFSVVVNLLGTESRALAALGVSGPDELAARADALAPWSLPESRLASLWALPQQLTLSALEPRRIRTADSQQVVRLGRDVNLLEYPFGPYGLDSKGASIDLRQLHGALFFAESCAPEAPLVGRATFDISSSETMSVSLPARHALLQTVHAAAVGAQIPFAVVLGGHPTWNWAERAMALPFAAHAFPLLGFLRGQPVELVQSRTQSLLVPADAEMIIEGYIDPQMGTGDDRHSGPTSAAPLVRLPIFVTAITHRAAAVLSLEVPTLATGENLARRRTELHLLKPLLKRFIATITDLAWPESGGGSSTLFVGVQSGSATGAIRTMHSVLAIPAFDDARVIVLVDESVPLTQENRVWQQVATQTHFERDLYRFPGQSHAPGQLVIDATGSQHSAPRHSTAMSAEVMQEVARRWLEFGLPG